MQNISEITECKRDSKEIQMKERNIKVRNSREIGKGGELK